jgi:hypothetical protein
MNDLATHVALVAGIVATFFIGPGVALAVVLTSKRRRRAQRRSPISRDLLRSPGHTVREQLDEATSDLTFDVLTVSIVPLLMLAMYLAGRVWKSTQTGHEAVIYSVVGLGTVLWLSWRMTKRGERIERLRAGFDAELAVGQELDQLMREGAWVYHDIPGENFNIDHVVVSTRGVFAVETKGYTKPTDLPMKDATVTYDGRSLRFPMWTVSEPLEQADRQAQWLSKWVSSAAGVAVDAVPVVALPGWFVDLKGRGNVRVYNGKQLSTLLRSPRARGLSDDEVQRVVHQVEQRCRTVVPTLRREPK